MLEEGGTQGEGEQIDSVSELKAPVHIYARSNLTQPQMPLNQRPQL